MNIIAVIVHDRLDNLKEWIRCYKLSETKDSELVIIHNFKSEGDISIYKDVCDKENIKYIQRINIGFDIGAFQDVCKERLEGFPNNWKYLLWSADDTIPMYKKFIPSFLEVIQKHNVGIACIEISNEVKRHIRTSGFMISKEISKRLVFPADPILSKNHCYEFEHRSKYALFEQILRMHKKVLQVSPTLMVSHLWDTDHRKNLNRWEEHYKEFPK